MHTIVEENMDLNSVKSLCTGLGEVAKFNENTAVFGNVELEIITPNRKTRIYITSDRGELSCYVRKRGSFTKKMIPLDYILNVTGKGESLTDLIDYLKSNIHEIEK